MMISPAPNGVAVLATQLPGTDRRALSQAWYSALHLSEGHTTRGQTSVHAPPRSAPALPRPNGAVTTLPGDLRPALGTRMPAQNARAAWNGVPTERRAPRTDLARRIERALAPRPRAPIVPSASLAISVGDGRVHLLVRTDGGTTRIVALCAPALKERLESALAQARFTLAGTGVKIAVDAR